MVGCTYGPMRTDVRIANHVFAPGGGEAAFALLATRYRPPTGLSTFPDGGTPLVFVEEASVYTCDTLTGAFRQIWRALRPGTIRSGFTPWLGPWTESGLYVSLRGYGTTTTDPAAFRRINYLIHPTGEVDSGVTEPALGLATSEPAECAQAVLADAGRHQPGEP